MFTPAKILCSVEVWPFYLVWNGYLLNTVPCNSITGPVPFKEIFSAISELLF